MYRDKEEGCAYKDKVCNIMYILFKAQKNKSADSTRNQTNFNQIDWVSFKKLLKSACSIKHT